MSAHPTLERYFEEAASWDSDRVELTERSARIAWRVAIVAVLALVASVVALAGLTPLKRVEPFLIRVDNTTGIVDVVPIYLGTAPMDELVTRYFLRHYVTVCERFNFSTAESDYKECGAFHAPQRNQAWLELWTRTNPASPLNVHKDGSSVRVNVQSVSFIRRESGISDLAQVRYLKSQRQGSGAERQTHWIATIQYAFAKPDLDPEIRGWNPMGFKVVDFRPEAEAITEQPTAAGAQHPSEQGESQ